MNAIALALASVAALVVLDPGHGGDEPGAVGAGAVAEKDVVLAIARGVRERLTDRGIRVVMTRTDDSNPSLVERLEKAHRLDADAFLSLHLNSSPTRDRRGVETYVASVLAIEGETAHLVEREEPTEVTPRNTTASPVELLLADLDARAAHRESADLAAAIQDALARVDGLRPSRGLRQAPFYVLREARVPAVLVEIGYVTHPKQAEFLASTTGQREVAQRMTEGILRFLGAR